MFKNSFFKSTLSQPRLTHFWIISLNTGPGTPNPIPSISSMFVFSTIDAAISFNIKEPFDERFVGILHRSKRLNSMSKRPNLIDVPPISTPHKYFFIGNLDSTISIFQHNKKKTSKWKLFLFFMRCVFLAFRAIFLDFHPVRMRFFILRERIVFFLTHCTL